MSKLFSLHHIFNWCTDRLNFGGGGFFDDNDVDIAGLPTNQGCVLNDPVNALLVEPKSSFQTEWMPVARLTPLTRSNAVLMLSWVWLRSEVCHQRDDEEFVPRQHAHGYEVDHACRFP